MGNHLFQEFAIATQSASNQLTKMVNTRKICFQEINRRCGPLQGPGGDWVSSRAAFCGGSRKILKKLTKKRGFLILLCPEIF
jgi:hypothetical protein